MFNHKIRHIVTEELLREAASLEKIVNAITKNNPDDYGASEIGQLIMADPTSVSNDRGEFVGKYWKWIYNQYKKGNIKWGDMPELEAALNTYNINKSQINKSIDNYRSLDELVREISQYNDSFKAKRTLSKGEQELEKVYEDQYVTVYIPHTWKAARKIGGDTHWCTASSDDKNFNYYLNTYGGEYYVIIRKSDGAKFQLHPESGQFMNANDSPVNFAVVFKTRKEADGFIRFLKLYDKEIRRWEPKTWFDEVEEKLVEGVNPYEIFDAVYEISESDCSVVNLNKKFNYITTKNKLISPSLWFDFASFFHEGFGAVQFNGKYNYIKEDGEILSPDLWFDSVDVFSGGVARVEIGGEKNFIKVDGSLLSPDMWFDVVGDFNDGIAKVRIGEKYNFIKTNGELLSPDKWFDWSSNFSEGVARVKIGGKWAFIDTDGSLFTSRASKTLVDKKTLMEMKRKTIVITEDMAGSLVDDMISEAFRARYSINSGAVLQVVRYLDAHFTRDTITDVTNDDTITDILVGNRMDSHGQVVDQPNLPTIVKMLEDVPELKGLISDKKIRRKFFAIVVYAWHRNWIDMQTGIIYGLNDFEV